MAPARIARCHQDLPARGRAKWACVEACLPLVRRANSFPSWGRVAREIDAGSTSSAPGYLDQRLFRFSPACRSTTDASGRSRYRPLFVGFVFKAQSALRRTSAVENVDCRCFIARSRPISVRRLCPEALEQVGLADRAGHAPAQLSVSTTTGRHRSGAGLRSRTYGRHEPTG